MNLIFVKKRMVRSTIQINGDEIVKRKKHLSFSLKINNDFNHRLIFASTYGDHFLFPIFEYPLTTDPSASMVESGFVEFVWNTASKSIWLFFL